MTTPFETTTPPGAAAAPATRRPRWLVPAAVAAAVGAVAVSAAVLAGGDDAAPRRPVGAAAPLVLKAPDPTVMASCLRFDEKILGEMSPAFGGTVTEVTDGKVVLDVDRWFSPADSDVERVELTSQVTGIPTSVDGVEFEQGNRYLVTAADGAVNTCGYSGLATAEYEAAWERAFAG